MNKYVVLSVNKSAFNHFTTNKGKVAKPKLNINPLHCKSEVLSNYVHLLKYYT